MALYDTVFYCNAGNQSSTGYYAVAKWAAGATIAAGALRRQNAAPAINAERVFIAIVAGTTNATTEPTWVITRGAKTTDGTVTWMETTGVAAVNGDQTNTPTWSAARALSPNPALGAIIRRNNGASYWICTTAGTVGASEPAWPNDTAGTTQTDNTVTWTCIGVVGNFSGGGAPHARFANVFGSGTNAFTAGATLYVGDNHAESQATAISVQPAVSTTNVGRILCHNHAGNYPPTASDLTTGASISTTAAVSITYTMSSGYMYVYGLSFIPGVGVSSAQADFVFGSGVSTAAFAYFDNCLFKVASTFVGASRIALNTQSGIIIWNNCTVSLGSSASYVDLGSSNFTWQNTGPVLAAGSVVPNGLIGVSIFGRIVASVLEALDLSQLTGSLINNAVAFPNGSIKVKDCKRNSAMTISTSTFSPNCLVQFMRYDSIGTAYKSERYLYEGTETTEASITRINGAIDPTGQAQSRKIATGANVFWNRPFPAEPYAIYNPIAGGNVTVTVYGVINAAALPNNDEAWMDVEYLGASSSPLGTIVSTTKSSILAANAPVASDSSAWDVIDASQLRNNSFGYNVGDEIRTASNTGYVFFCITAGISAASEPASVNVNTLNPADVQTMTLSNGNLTATPTAAFSAVRSASVQRSGKFYFEAAVNSGTMSNQTTIGIATNDTVNPYTGMQHGVSNLIGSGSTIWINGVSTGIVSTVYAVGNTMCVAVDLTNQKIWFRVNAANWNNSGTANPATNTGGVDISSVFSNQPVYAVVSSGSGNGPMTINLGGSSFAQAVPSGFSGWNVNAQPTVTFANADQGDYVVDGTAVFDAVPASTPFLRQNSFSYAVGNVLKVTSNPGRVFFCTTAGVSASSEPGGYATAVDGGSVTDGAATFRAGMRFKLAATLSSPQPGMAGYIEARARVAKPSTTFYLDPRPVLS